MKKNLQMIPARIALALQKDGWILRNDIIWFKPNHMPSSVKDRLTNTYEHIFHFVKSKKYYYDLDSIRVPHKTGPASFNYRVREAKHGHIEIKGVKDSSKEMEQHDKKGQRIRGLKTKGKARIGQEQYHGQDVNYHLSGKNPGDVFSNTGINNKEPYNQNNPHRLRLEGNKDCTHPLGKNPGDVFYQSKFNGRCQGKRLSQSLSYARRVLGKEHETAISHPLGKNPGDILFVDDKGKLGAERRIMQESGYVNQHSGYMLAGLKIKSRLGMDIRNPVGKNPGDVAKIGMHHGSSLTKGRAAHYDKQRLIEHPLGKNPGDVLNSPLNHAIELNKARGKLRSNGTIAGHYLDLPLVAKHYAEGGKNPGDVILPIWKVELIRLEQIDHLILRGVLAVAVVILV